MPGALPFAVGGPAASGTLRAVPEDFEVDEIPGFEPSCDGEHHWLRIEKRGANTEWVARQLAAFADVSPMDVGYAGRKDRHALTRQVFTVRAPARREIDWSAFAAAGVRVLSNTRHARKLPRGALAGNRFSLRVRDVTGDTTRALEQFHEIASSGMPNFFGEQRFGRDAGNLAAAAAMFAGRRVRREERNLLLSAARSSIFNAVLAERIDDGSWNQGAEGDVWQIDGSGSIFGPEPMTPAIAERSAALAIHPTGPLWGRGSLRTSHDIAAIERRQAEAQEDFARGLEAAGVAMQRRALRVRVEEASATRERDDLVLRFVLPAGSYATSLLRELIGDTGGTLDRSGGTGQRDAED